MKKYLSLIVAILFMTGCVATNPPDAPAAKGDWQTINTNVSDIMKGL